jgi:oligoendopeptidase F
MDWDLKSYFPVFDGPEYRKFWRGLTTELAVLAQPLPGTGGSVDQIADGLVDWLIRYEKATTHLSHIASYLSCLTAADSANESYAAEQAALSLKWASLEKARNVILETFGNASDDQITCLMGDSRLVDAAYTLDRLHCESRHRMSPQEEALTADLGVDGFDAWGRLYDTISGNLEFEMVYPDGSVRTLPMSQRRSLLGHPDREIRKAAFDGGNRTWESMARVAAAAINSLAGTRNTLLRRRGQKQFIEPVLFDARIGRPCLDALFEALGQRQEVGREVLRFKAAQMGRSRVAWFDLEAPTQTKEDDEAPIEWSEACQWVQEAFDRSYPELGSFFREVVAKRWIDWSPRRGKLPGGFCTTSSLSGESRIFMTYNGTVNDVMTLAHEAGHAFHGHLLADRRGLVRSYPMTLAETASTFAEQLLAEGIIGDPDRPAGHKKRLLDSQVRHAVTFLLDIPIRYNFERRFNEERQTGEVSVSRLKALMSETQREWLGDILASDGEDPFFWASKLHFYITDRSFYNFPYTFGFLLSRKLFTRYRAEGLSFLQHYKAFLRGTSTQDADSLILEVLQEDPDDPSFWTSAIDSLREPFEAYRRLIVDSTA